MLKSLLLAGIDSGFNALLQLDPASRSRLAALSGQVLAIQGREPEFNLFLLLHDNGIQLAAHWDGEADCTLTASAAELWQLATTRDKHAALHQPGVSIEGNHSLLQQLSDILHDMDIDWEYQLQQWFGPVAASLIGGHLRLRYRWTAAALASLQQRLQDWLAEEARLLVGNNEARVRFAELDQLKLQLDRLEARAALIAQRLESDTP